MLATRRHVHVSGGLQECGATRVVYDRHENLQLKTNVNTASLVLPKGIPLPLNDVGPLDFFWEDKKSGKK